jgi:integrase
MSVRQDKKTKKWYYEFYYKTTTGETKRRKQRGFDLKKEAAEAEAYEKVKLNETPPAKMPFRDLYKMYTEAKTPEWLPGTKNKFETAIKLHILPYFGNFELDKITPRDIENWKILMYNKKTKEGTPYSAESLNRFRGNLAALMNYAQNRQFIAFNPIKAVPSFKNPAKMETTEKQVWDETEFKTFISAVDNEQWKLFFTFLWCTGTRIGEAQGVMFKDINLTEKSVTISKSIDTQQKGKLYVINPTKTKKPRTIELPETYIEILNPHIEKQKKLPKFKETNFLFGYTRPLPKTTIDKARTDYIKQSGVKYISSHCFRHSHATYLLSNGVDVKSVSERLGHKDVAETLNTYAHVLPNSRDKIIKLLNPTIIK